MQGMLAQCTEIINVSVVKNVLNHNWLPDVSIYVVTSCCAARF